MNFSFDVYPYHYAAAKVLSAVVSQMGNADAAGKEWNWAISFDEYAFAGLSKQLEDSDATFRTMVDSKY